MFEGRNLLIASMHQKEKVLTPLLHENLRVTPCVVNDFNTDVFGTFSGEIERKGDAISALRQKCDLAYQTHKIDLVVASEGSFGPHPSYFFVPANEELIMFKDYTHQLEIVARHITTETNFSGEEINTEEALLSFANKVNFPTHGLILRKSKDNFSEIFKGITDLHVLLNTFLHFQKTTTSVYVETDMRAHMNPTRMKSIEACGIELIKKINSCCPACTTPGFDVDQVLLGLPCDLCETPTQSILSLIYTCKKCAFQEEKKFPKGKNTEDPMYCNRCNP
jgi:hypothetical protein